MDNVPLSSFGGRILTRSTWCNENPIEKEDVKHRNKNAVFRLQARLGNFSLKSHLSKVLPNKSSLAEIIKKIPIINGNDRLKICICDPKVSTCCPERPPIMVLNRQRDLNKTNRREKTYLDTIVDRGRLFCKTSANYVDTQPLPLVPSTKSCPIIKDESSTVFTGSIECPFDKKRVEYYLWIRPNKKKRTVLCAHSNGLKPFKKPSESKVK